jgi:hypothetical protein
MKSTSSIQYLAHNEIDKVRWDECITKAENGLIYAQSFCLDNLCEWDALILNEYEAVMPLPYKRKWGIRYVYQVPFFQQLGIFGTLSPGLIEAFFKEAEKHFRFIHYNVNQCIPGSRFKFLPRTNYIINLRVDYNIIQANYTKECVSNIRKAKQRGCTLSNDTTVEEVIDLYKAAYGPLHKGVTYMDYEMFANLLKQALQNQSAELYSIKDGNDQTIFASALLRDTRRLYYIMGAPSELGRKNRATYFFIDNILRKYAGSNLHFDMEGSDITNVANFYKQFDPEAEVYYESKYNNLPLPLKLLK